jgi:DNA replicative helicase MCM subunit Mcm2 (Cdc46/Mcm family)
MVCQHTVQIDIDRGKIQEPERCPRDVCNVVGSMNLIHNRSVFMNKQVIRLQETPGTSFSQTARAIANLRRCGSGWADAPYRFLVRVR